MQLTLAGEYAIRTMIHLAEKEGFGVVHINEISRDQNIPEKFLRKIIPLLVSAGLIKSRKGNGGGICLNRDSNEITPLEIIQAVEGPIALNKCLIDKEFCSNTRWCSVHTLWCDILAEMRLRLSIKSLKDLVEESQRRKKAIQVKNKIGG